MLNVALLVVFLAVLFGHHDAFGNVLSELPATPRPCCIAPVGDGLVNSYGSRSCLEVANDPSTSQLEYFNPNMCSTNNNGNCSNRCNAFAANGTLFSRSTSENLRSVSYGPSLAGYRGAVYDGVDSLWMIPYASGAKWVVQVYVQTGHTIKYDLPSAVPADLASKYIGAVFDGTYVWLAPHVAKGILRFTPSAAKTSSSPRSLTSTMVEFKNFENLETWLEGTPFASGACMTHAGDIIFAPHNARYIARLPHADKNNSTSLVKTISLPPHVRNEAFKTWGLVCDQRPPGNPLGTGAVFFAPRKLSMVLKLDTSTWEASFVFSELWQRSDHVYVIALDAANDALWLMPITASTRLVQFRNISAAGGSVTVQYATGPDIPGQGSFRMYTWLFDGRYLIPIASAGSERVLTTFDTQTRTIEPLVTPSQNAWPPDVGWAGGSGAMFGGALLVENSLWLIPFDSNVIVRWYDATVQSFQQDGLGFSGMERVSIPMGEDMSKFTVLDYGIMTNATDSASQFLFVGGGSGVGNTVESSSPPSSSSPSLEKRLFYGGCFDGNQYMYFAPAWKGGTGIVRINTNNGSWDNVGSYEDAKVRMAGTTNFAGCSMAGPYIVFPPYGNQDVGFLRLDTRTQTLSALTRFNRDVWRMSGAVYDGLGFVWSVSSTVVKVAVSDGNMVHYSNWGSAYTAPTAQSLVFDGFHIWTIPYNKGPIGKIPRNIATSTTKLTYFNTWPPELDDDRGWLGGLWDARYKKLWLIPYFTATLVAVDGTTGSINVVRVPASSYVDTFGFKFAGGVLSAADPYLYFTPAAGTRSMLRVQREGPHVIAGFSRWKNATEKWKWRHLTEDEDRITTPKPSSLPPSAFLPLSEAILESLNRSYKPAPFIGGVYDARSKSLWLVPSDVSRLVRIVGDGARGVVVDVDSDDNGKDMNPRTHTISPPITRSVSLTSSPTPRKNSDTLNSTATFPHPPTTETKSKSNTFASTSETRSIAPDLEGAASTVSGSITLAVDLEAPQAPPPPTAPAPLLEGMTSKRVVLETVMSSDASEAVVSTSTATSAVTSIANPAVATQAARASSVVRTLSCQFDPNDLEEISFLEHPVRSVAVCGMESNGKHVLDELACSGFITMLFFIFVPCFANLMFLRFGQKRVGGGGGGGGYRVAESDVAMVPLNAEEDERESSNSSDSSSSGGSRSLPSERWAQRPSLGLRAQEFFISVWVGITLAYFVPNSLYAALVVLFHRDYASSTGVALSVVSVLFLTGLLSIYIFLLLQRFEGNVVVGGKQRPRLDRILSSAPSESRTTSSSSSSSTSWAQRIIYLNGGILHYVEALGPLFDATQKGFTSRLCRFYYFEEVLVTCLMMVAAAIQPEGAGNCGKISGVMVVLAVLHLAYLLYTFPYCSKIESVFAFAHAFLQLFLATMATISIEQEKELAVEAVAYGLLLQSALFFVQVVLSAVWAWIRENRRNALQNSDEELELHVPAGKEGNKPRQSSSKKKETKKKKKKRTEEDSSSDSDSSNDHRSSTSSSSSSTSHGGSSSSDDNEGDKNRNVGSRSGRPMVKKNARGGATNSKSNDEAALNPLQKPLLQVVTQDTTV